MIFCLSLKLNYHKIQETDYLLLTKSSGRFIFLQCFIYLFIFAYNHFAGFLEFIAYWSISSINIRTLSVQGWMLLKWNTNVTVVLKSFDICHHLWVEISWTGIEQQKLFNFIYMPKMFVCWTNFSESVSESVCWFFWLVCCFHCVWRL